ncbi:hypothetical protein MPL3356_270088 [Mesorhizobium plurifarium]|uniref:Uncharacterized protein n=1 Tax=Mesorhizobium plurifarium TaxID=69974 RepID=A0A090FYK6_MESPL|nr:hypothetical protein MPL3356_270088 [Mesorhizobium plurifarium]CDX52654.1 hypothetical protein MPL3365_170018 [Mesorhizobium plurifarium]
MPSTYGVSGVRRLNLLDHLERVRPRIVPAGFASCCSRSWRASRSRWTRALDDWPGVAAGTHGRLYLIGHFGTLQVRHARAERAIKCRPPDSPHLPTSNIFCPPIVLDPSLVSLPKCRCWSSTPGNSWQPFLAWSVKQFFGIDDPITGEFIGKHLGHETVAYLSISSGHNGFSVR